MENEKLSIVSFLKSLSENQPNLHRALWIFVIAIVSTITYYFINGGFYINGEYNGVDQNIVAKPKMDSTKNDTTPAVQKTTVKKPVDPGIITKTVTKQPEKKVDQLSKSSTTTKTETPKKQSSEEENFDDYRKALNDKLREQSNEK